jgi:hypothetical protein
MFLRVKASGPRQYLQLVENRREGGTHKQHVLATLGRLDLLAASGQLQRLLAAGAALCDQALLLSTLAGGPGLALRRVGAPLLFRRLWEETGCHDVIATLAAGRRFGFPLETAVFVATLHRLMVSGSDRACEGWVEDYDIPGADGLALHHFYRAMAWLGEELADQDGAGSRPEPPRTWSRNACSPAAAISSASSRWSSSTPPRSPSTAAAGQASVGTATPRIIGPSSPR